MSNSQAIEDYVKAIYAIAGERQGEGPVQNGEVAERLGVTPATATAMLQKLAELGLVAYQPYKGVSLTSSGERVALEVIRHHRLIEAYLAEELEALIAAKLGEPSHDPHGSAIPGPDLLPPTGSVGR